MTVVHCGSVRPLLGALVDGELSGAEMLRVAGHLDVCGACTSEVDELREVGDLMRGIASRDELPALEGFADGILTRTRAEQEQSWSRLFGRAVEDWHWAIVGFGSVTATSLMTLFVAAVVLFGPGPGRSDSLAAVLNDFGRSTTSFVVLDQAENWDGASGHVNWVASGRTPPRAAFLGGSPERDLVRALSETVRGTNRLTVNERQYVEMLLDQISDIRWNPSEARLISSITVSASSP